jgi:hypothetical protein
MRGFVTYQYLIVSLQVSAVVLTEKFVPLSDLVYRQMLEQVAIDA